MSGSVEGGARGDTRMTPRRLPQKIVSSYVETLQGRAHVSSTERLAKTDLARTLGGKSKPPDDLPDATASTIQPHYGGKIVTGLEWGGRLWDWTAWEYMPIEYPENGLPSLGC